MNPSSSRAPDDVVHQPAGYETLGLELLLYGLQSPVNIGMILRAAEAFRFAVSILDQYGVLVDAAKLSTLQDFACGALRGAVCIAWTVPRPWPSTAAAGALLRPRLGPMPCRS